MLSKVFASVALRQSRVAPRFMQVANRRFTEHWSYGNQVPSGIIPMKSDGQVDLWKEAVKKQETALVLRDHEQIEKYVLSICRDYFRTTKKASIQPESILRDHGLDSLDLIELVIQIEDELGYLIDAENLSKFEKPKHFINFIKHMEAYKEEFHRLPNDNQHEKFDIKEAFPGLIPEKKAKSSKH